MALFEVYTIDRGTTARSVEVTQSEDEARHMVKELTARGKKAWYEQIQ